MSSRSSRRGWNGSRGRSRSLGTGWSRCMTSVRSNIQIYAAFVQTWHELYHILDILEPEEGEHAEVMYRFLSRNMVKGAWQATDEEKLIELVLELRDHLSTDQEVEPSDPDED